MWLVTIISTSSPRSALQPHSVMRILMTSMLPCRAARWSGFDPPNCSAASGRCTDMGCVNAYMHPHASNRHYTRYSMQLQQGQTCSELLKNITWKFLNHTRQAKDGQLESVTTRYFDPNSGVLISGDNLQGMQCHICNKWRWREWKK